MISRSWTARTAGLVILILPLVWSIAHSQTLRFERFVPALQQPWYFSDGVDGVAAVGDTVFAVSEGSAFALSRTGRVITLAPPSVGINAFGLVARDGLLYIPTLGGVAQFDQNFRLLQTLSDADSGSAGEINQANALDFMSDGSFVVVDVDEFTADGSANSVKIYDADFRFQSSFQGLGVCAIGFPRPQAGLLVAPDDTIYVTDSCNNEIRHFTPSGTLIRTFGSSADTLNPQDLVFSADGSQLLVANGRDVAVFDADSATLVDRFSPPPSGSNFFPSIDIAPDGTYLLGSISAVHRFSSEFELLSSFQGASRAEGFFNEPRDIAVDNRNGLVYVSEFRNSRVSALDGEGQVVRIFDSTTPLFGDIDSTDKIVNLGPIQEAINGFPENFYGVTDCNGVKFFSGDGTTYAPLATPQGTQPGQFLRTCSKRAGTIDGLEIYLTDFGNDTVKVFNTATYEFVREWVSINPETNAPMRIRSLTTDGEHLIALSLDRVVFYNEDGVPQRDFDIGRGGTDITYTQLGDLLVTSQGGLKRYTLGGELIQESVLPRGVGPGQVRSILNSSAVDLGSDQIVVADGRNNRVKYFRALTTTDNPKAIVVAGGGPYPGNALWDATRVNANFGYRTLLNQGFDKDAVQYLSDDNADLDQNGVEDDIDARAIGSELEAAITGAFSADATELVIYLVDHGGDDTFRLSGNETITSTQLNEWLDTWQQASGGQRITVIYDACQSGSFVDEISAGSANRIVIASARADQSAYFVSQGALSFSNQFWTQIFNGQSLKAAYEAATEVIEQAFPTQNPILDSNGNGIGNETADFAVLDLIGGGFIGNGTIISGSRPIITSVFPPTTLANGNETVLTAFGVTDSDGVARVWATLIPPGYVPGSADNPVSELPTVNLDSQSGDDFSASFAGFSEIGTYQVVIYAEDGFGNVSVPSISTVTVNSPLQRRAVIIAGGDQSDAGFAAVSANTRLAYAALEQQGYGPDGVSCDSAICDAVQFLTPEAVAGFDATATLSNVEDAISVWGATETQDLTVYLTGPRGGGGFQLAGDDVLTAAALDGFLDIAEAANPGRVTVIVDGDLAGEFVNQLTPSDGRRFLIASASGTDVAANALEGVVSFSRFFWSQTLNGATVFDAFRQARSGIRFAADCQNPEIDTDGNNVPNQLFDGLSAGAYRIGSGILLAGDAPLIESTQGPSVVTEGSAYNLTVSGITTTGTIDRVVAVIGMNGSCEVTQVLNDLGNGRWGGELPMVDFESPRLSVAAFAVDDDGNVSLPVTRSVVGDLVFRNGLE